MERRLLRYGDLTIKRASTTVTIPIGGGSATASLTLSNFGLTKKIEVLLSVVVRRQTPIVSDVYAPSAGINASLDAVGLTVYAGSGTTLAVDVTVMGI